MNTVLNSVRPNDSDFIAECLADIALVVDSSGSIRDNNPPGVGPDDPEDNWTILVNFLKLLIDDLDVPNTRVGTVIFGNRARVLFNLTRYQTREEMKNEIGNFTYNVRLCFKCKCRELIVCVCPCVRRRECVCI